MIRRLERVPKVSNVLTTHLKAVVLVLLFTVCSTSSSVAANFGDDRTVILIGCMPGSGLDSAKKCKIPVAPGEIVTARVNPSNNQVQITSLKNNDPKYFTCQFINQENWECSEVGIITGMLDGRMYINLSIGDKDGISFSSFKEPLKSALIYKIISFDDALYIDGFPPAQKLLDGQTDPQTILGTPLVNFTKNEYSPTFVWILGILAIFGIIDNFRNKTG